MTSCSASCGGGVVRQAREVLSESSRGILNYTYWRWRAKLTRTVMVDLLINIFKKLFLNLIIIDIVFFNIPI